MPPAESGDFRRPQALLAPRVASGASAEAVALAWLLLWQAVERALIPIVGVRGVAALFNRSLRLAAEAGHPWLDPRRAEPGSRVDAPALQARLAQRGSAGDLNDLANKVHSLGIEGKKEERAQHDRRFHERIIQISAEHDIHYVQP